MNNGLYDEVRLEKLILQEFGLRLNVDSLVARNFAVGRNDRASLFLSHKKQLYLFIEGESRLLLGDVRKIVAHVGLKPELYVPPRGRPDYFNEIATQKFRDVFPGRKHISDEDLTFYRTLAPYNPALVLIGEVKNDGVYQYDPDASGGWRLVTKFTYRRIRTS